MTTNTGGPAFPVTDDASDVPGMTLRDYFAAKAMQGFISNHSNQPDFTRGEIAEFAYKMANAMMEARSE